MSTCTQEFTICNKLGMHARPAAQFVKRASRFSSNIWVEKDDEQVNGKSIMGLMMLAAGPGTTIRLVASGPEAEAALDALGGLVAKHFGEEE